MKYYESGILVGKGGKELVNSNQVTKTKSASQNVLLFLLPIALPDACFGERRGERAQAQAGAVVASHRDGLYLSALLYLFILFIKCFKVGTEKISQI